MARIELDDEEIRPEDDGNLEVEEQVGDEFIDEFDENYIEELQQQNDEITFSARMNTIVKPLHESKRFYEKKCNVEYLLPALHFELNKLKKLDINYFGFCMYHVQKQIDEAEALWITYQNTVQCRDPCEEDNLPDINCALDDIFTDATKLQEVSCKNRIDFKFRD